jgi:hypothetical protein
MQTLGGKMNDILRKLVSGKFLFTIIAALVFAYVSVAKILPVDKVHEILILVVYAYFSKQSNQPKGGV